MTELRLAGFTRGQVLTTLVSALPIGRLALGWYQTHGQLVVAWWIWVGCACILAMPWIIRAGVRKQLRARFDDTGLFVGSEAIPWAKITAVDVGRRGRRRYLIFKRQNLPDIYLCLEDPYAGRLTPIAALHTKLAAIRPDDEGTRKIGAMIST